MKEKKNALRNFTANIATNESFRVPYKIAKGLDIKHQISQTTIKPNGNETTNMKESIENIMNYHFPTRNNEIRIKPNSHNLEPLFTMQELELVFKNINYNKAPGSDKIPAEVYRDLFYSHKGWFLDIMNRALCLAHFPTIWKKARLCLIPKQGKDLTRPESYRPICLLSNFGKVCLINC